MKFIALPLSLAAVAPVASAQSFNVDFGPGSGTAGTGPPSAAYGGAAGSPGTWNWLDTDGFIGTSDYTQALVDLSGGATGVSLRCYDPSGFGTFAALSFDEINTTGDDALLMDDIVYMGAWTMDFTGLAPGSYDVYTYAMAPDSSAFLTSVDVVGGAGGPQDVGGDFSAGHQPHVTYAWHTVTVDSSGLLQILIDVTASFDSVNGVQIVSSGGSQIGTNTCGPANNNSTGAPGVIAAFGSTSVALNNLTLTASGLPVGKMGLFANSMTGGFTTPPNSQGNLCLGGAIGRQRTAVLVSDANGEFSLSVDLNDVRTPGGPVAVMPGETWIWQAWYQDDNPGATSNFTDSVSITFQ